MYKYLFGPVPSRRLGMSLGVDLVPGKVCSLDCVYCEVGKTTKLSTERKEYVLYDKVVEELNNYFTNNPDPDYITFSGSGEPTLNSRLGDVIRFIKERKPNIPIAVLTNGTLLSDKTLQEELSKVDLLLPSLDAVSEVIFKKINRPSSDLSAEKLIKGIVDFRKGFRGKIWLEVFILPGFNYQDKELEKFKKVLNRINPDSIQLNTLDRPGTEQNLYPAGREELEHIKNIWNLDNVEIISSAPQKHNNLSYRIDTESAILGTISRRPCTIDDMEGILGIGKEEIIKYIDRLLFEDRVETVEQERGVFYQKRN